VVPTWAPLPLYAHQQRVRDARDRGVDRFFLPWHRRGGKDTFALDFAREEMLKRPGSYWHLFPFHVQAKRAIWKGIDARGGVRFIDRAFPKHMRSGENDTEMSLSIKGPKGEASWQMLGSDNYDRMVGSNPIGIIFSEWALCDPAAWDYIRPILIENGGWALFITTFRGRNHAWRMYQTVKELENWYTELLTIDDTYRLDGSPIVSKADVQKEIAAGMKPALVQQEFYCDPDAATDGAIFSRQHTRLAALLPSLYTPNSRIIRVAWGMANEGISAIAFQDTTILGVHNFLESNFTDCVQAITRRHPDKRFIHHAANPDTALFSELDGHGVVKAQISADEHMRQGRVAAALNVCTAVGAARESLVDFAMSYAPFREQTVQRAEGFNTEEEEKLVQPAMCEALAVVQSAFPFSRAIPRAPMDYSQYDRGIV
jgi:hypothetical protein